MAPPFSSSLAALRSLKHNHARSIHHLLLHLSHLACFSSFSSSSSSSLAVRRSAGERVRWAQAAAFSSGFVAGEKPILVRDFVRSALYDPAHGYFSKRSGPVGVLESSIRFHQLQGRSAYMEYLDKLYKKHDIAWFTPVELFKPWYAYAIAEAILRTANLSVPLKIIEIGGGSGTCAKCILDYMMLNAPPKVYSNMTYISVEISSSLAEKQLETVGEVKSHLSRFKVECRDATNKIGWGHKDTQPCWVLMLEVLWRAIEDLSPPNHRTRNNAGGRSDGGKQQVIKSNGPETIKKLRQLDAIPSTY